MKERDSASLAVAEIKRNMACELGAGNSVVNTVLDGEESAWLQGLLLLTDQEFVTGAYRFILGREVDPDGLRNYCDKLSHLKISRLEIVVALRLSSEGRRYKKVIPGFASALMVTAFCRLPLVKSLIRSFLLTAISGL